MKIKDHWLVVTNDGEIVATSTSETDSWDRAKEAANTSIGLMRHIGYRCVKCKIEETT